jgi:hypothetical protein
MATVHVLRALLPVHVVTVMRMIVVRPARLRVSVLHGGPLVLWL